MTKKSQSINVQDKELAAKKAKHIESLYKNVGGIHAVDVSDPDKKDKTKPIAITVKFKQKPDFDYGAIFASIEEEIFPFELIALEKDKNKVYDNYGYGML